MLFLFSDTIEKNILFAIEDESQVDASMIDEVVYKSALRNEIDRFPDHLNSVVGEKGIMLSGGQKQRVSIARAMMKSAHLLILDNVLSAVDYETERFLLKQIFNKQLYGSLLIVSHRVQALERADMILVLENGQVTDRGTHCELIKRPGLYRETYKLQEQKGD